MRRAAKLTALVADFDEKDCARTASAAERYGICVLGRLCERDSILSALERMQPALVFLDIVLPAADGLGVLHEIRKKAPLTRVIVVTAYCGEHAVLKVFEAGVLGYIHKRDGVAQWLRSVVGAVLDDKLLYSPTPNTILAGELQALRKKQPAGALLTKREEEAIILRYGHPLHNRPEAAERMHISPKTLDNHVYSARDKLGAESDLDLYQYAKELLDRRAGAKSHGEGIRESSPLGLRIRAAGSSR